MESTSFSWKENKNLLETKKIQQIISFFGEGKLTDKNETSIELRQLLSEIPSSHIKKYCDECLNEKFVNSGFVLQDLVNQIGERIGFTVEYGVYRGRINNIGFDGLWKSKDNTDLLIEVKTSDAYRINLDTIADYREDLIKADKLTDDKSSILLVVGRQDTGDLEAQIRGSKHAWDLRVISVDSLIRLLEIKEKLNDQKTTQQIIQALKPLEYTRIDKLVELIFLTAVDLEIDDQEEKDVDENDTLTTPKFTPVSFHDDCIEKITDKTEHTFIKQGRVSFYSSDKKMGLIISISKKHETSAHDGKYWFAFHPHQQEYLTDFEDSYCVYGCGNSDNIFMIPYQLMEKILNNFWITEKDERMYWHIVIYEDKGKFKLQIPKKNDFIDINEYKI